MRRGILRALGAAVQAGEVHCLSQAGSQSSGLATRVASLGAECCTGSVVRVAGTSHAWSTQRFASSIIYPPVEAFVGSKAPDFKLPGKKQRLAEDWAT